MKLRMDKQIKNILKIVIISRVFILTVALLSNFLIDARTASGLWEAPIPFVNLFARWDSAYYMHIANFGYNEPHLWAFFPLYPLLMHLTHFLLPFDISLPGFLLSNVFFFLFLIYFYKLTAKIFNPKISFLSVLLVSFFPSSLFLSAVYAESLFLFLIIFSFYSLSEKKIVKSAFVGFLAGLAKPFGFLAGLPHLFNGFIRHSKKEILVGSIIFSSVVIFFIYMYLVTGDFLIFFNSQSKYWNAEIINNPLNSFAILTQFQKILVVLIMIISIFTFVDFFKRKKWYLREESKYYIFFLFIFLFSLNSPMFSFARFALTFIPIFWYLAKVWSDHKKLGMVIFILFLILNAYGTILFVNWYDFY